MTMTISRRSPFTGTIGKLTYQLGPEQLTDADHAVIGPALARARD